MEIKIDLKKSTEALSSAVRKSTEIGKKVSNNIQIKAKDISEKAKNDNYIRRMKKYNPLFPEKYFSTEFNLPNMIVIVDDAVRRGIDVCEGAIGWLSTENGMEVLHLYDEAVAESGIEFIPAAICDAVYYVDKFNRNRFIQVECIFSKAHEERLAELKNIAYDLGARKCSVEISESNKETEINKAKKESKSKANVNGVILSADAKSEQSSIYNRSSQRTGIIEIEFQGSSEIKIPTLKWFAHDETIKNLIKMRSENKNSVKSEILILEGSVSATMSKKTAYAIDGAISKISSASRFDMEGQAIKENHSKLIFSVEF